MFDQGPSVDVFYDVLPVFLQNVACSVGGLQRSRTRYTRHFHRTLADWESRTNNPVEDHRAYQWLLLKRVIEHAREHVPYYRDLPPPQDAADPAEAVARTLGDLPPLDKDTYRNRAREFLADDVPRNRLIELSTSGTTGTALPIWHTPERIAEGYAAVWRQRHRFMVGLHDPHITFGGRMIVPLRQRRPPFWRVNHYWKQTLFSIFHLSAANLPAYVDEIHRTNATYVQGYPSALYLVARAMLEENRPLEPGRLRGVFTSSESLLAFQREAIECAFGAPVRDHYAATELCVSMSACRLNQLHVDMEFCIVEVEPVEETADFVRGPMIVTGLGNRATPFIRYRIGDVGTLSKKPCPCGRPGEVFLDIDGRVEDYVITPEERLIGRLDHIFKGQFDVAEAQILQDERNSIRVLVVPTGKFSEESRKKLMAAIRKRLGKELHVVIQLVDFIPREANGKFRAVKSRIHGVLQ
jgi:phenylacetate-CoA ligase